MPNLHPAHHRGNLSRSQRLSDAITRFVGNIRFVVWHAIAFAVWMLFVEPKPWPTLTLVVSLEAIFLATFVLIGQNRMTEIDRERAGLDYVVNRETLALLVTLHAETFGPEATQKLLNDTD